MVAGFTGDDQSNLISLKTWGFHSAPQQAGDQAGEEVLRLFQEKGLVELSLPGGVFR